MKQPDKRTPFLFITLGIVTILLLLIDMATGDTYIPITKVWAVLTGGECDEMTRNISMPFSLLSVNSARATSHSALPSGDSSKYSPTYI